MHSDWRCDNCGDVPPFHVAEHINADIVVSMLRHQAAGADRVPFWCPWPLPAGWMVTGAGCKLNLPAKPADWLADADRWPRLRDQLKAWVATLARLIRQGDFPLKPRSENCSDHCDFGQVCRITQSRSAVERKHLQLPLPVVE